MKDRDEFYAALARARQTLAPSILSALDEHPEVLWQEGESATEWYNRLLGLDLSFLPADAALMVRQMAAVQVALAAVYPSPPEKRD